MAIGLKGSWKETRGCSLKYKFKELYWNLKYAWRRAWYGYDDRNVFNMDAMFVEKYKEILKDYKKHHNCYFNVPAEYKDVFNKEYFDEEETYMIIDMLIFHLEMMDEDFVEKKLYGKNIYDDDYNVNTDFSVEKAIHVAKIVDQNKNLFMKLFNIFFWDLWY